MWNTKYVVFVDLICLGMLVFLGQCLSVLVFTYEIIWYFLFFNQSNLQIITMQAFCSTFLSLIPSIEKILAQIFWSILEKPRKLSFWFKLLYRLSITFHFCVIYKRKLDISHICLVNIRIVNFIKISQMLHSQSVPKFKNG